MRIRVSELRQLIREMSGEVIDLNRQRLMRTGKSLPPGLDQKNDVEQFLASEEVSDLLNFSRQEFDDAVSSMKLRYVRDVSNMLKSKFPQMTNAQTNKLASKKIDEMIEFVVGQQINQY